MNHEKIVITDFDGTIIVGQSQVLLIKYLFSKKEIGLKILFEVLFWNLKYKFVKQKIDKDLVERLYGLLICGKSEAWVESTLNSFVDSVLAKKVSNKVLKMLTKYKKDGYKIVLLSSSTDIILEAFNRKYKIADEIICTTLEKSNFQYTGKIIGGINDGVAREKAVKNELKGLQAAEVVVVSDNLADLGLFKLAGKAIVVNPGKELSLFAKENNFEIIDI